MLNNLKIIFQKQGNHQSPGESGLTLIETLVALGLFAVIGAAVIAGMFTSHRTVGIVDEKTNARNLIIQHIEAIRLLPYAATYPNVGDNITVPNQYSVVIETECTDDDITWQACTGSETLQRIFVSVYREGRFVMKVCTFRTQREK